MAPVQASVEMLVPDGKALEVTVSALVVLVRLVFVMVISLVFPVRAAFE